MRRAAILVMLQVMFGAIIFGSTTLGDKANAAQQPTGTPVKLTCDTLLPLLQQNLAGSCKTTKPGQVCFGYGAITAEYVDPSAASKSPFTQPGDAVPITALKTVHTSALNIDQGQWGVAVFKVQTAKA